MIATKDQTLNPRFVRLDASTICQLKCPSCPTATGSTGKNLGVGFLKFEDFKGFVLRNPHVSHIELSNWGEVFLNKELIKILEYAYRHNIVLNIANGANMNYIREDVQEALVKYKLRRITCSIDGASQETYVKYRINGNFDKIIENIKAINRWKAKCRSSYPQLKWQFVVFGHNEHEIVKAQEMAKELGMEFYLKLSWGDLYDLPDFSPVQNKEAVGKEMGLGVTSRKEYLAKFGQDYVERRCCWDLWNAPQVNYDGRMLGCPINYWGDYGNVFEKGLDDCVNGEKMNYARGMLMGKQEPKEGIPCTSCKVYHGMRKDNAWVTKKDLDPLHYPGRTYIMLENKILGHMVTARLSLFISQLKEFFTQVKQGQIDLNLLREVFFPANGRAVVLPNQGYPLAIPLPMDEKKWKPHHLFRGKTKRIKDFSCHVSTLVPGHCPHPPHTHKEEEILMMLDGEADLLLPLHQGDRLRLKPGEFVYYPADYPHTLQTVSDKPANYLMFKWYTPKLMPAASIHSFEKYDINDALSRQENKDGFQTRTLFEGPSKWLTQLHCHTSILAPGHSYAPHVDKYDVAIIILEGEVETLGKRFAPHSVLFHPRGKPHGISNPGSVPAKYIVFQFD